MPTSSSSDGSPSAWSRLLSPVALEGSFARFANPVGRDLLSRTRPLFDWIQARMAADNWNGTRTIEAPPSARVEVHNEGGRRAAGLNFGSQDYLSLTGHADVLAAARQALTEHGLHSAGSPMLLGNTLPSERLEHALASFLQIPHVMLFPTGWGAGFGAIVGLVRPADHIVMDRLAHACLQSGAYAATRNVHRHDHLAASQVREMLRDIRARDVRNGILVVTEGLFSMDSDMPDLVSLQAACREFEATLLVDVAHDLGALGPGGRGALGMQGLLGKADLVMGSFSKTFASNGGFLATHRPEVRQFVKLFGGPHIFSNALSPVQAAVVNEALRIVRSEEGDRLRGQLMTAVGALRNGLEARGIRCLGEPSAIVPVPIGDERRARVAFSLLWDRGVIANMVEFPAVAVGAARFRMQVMAGHTAEQAAEAASVIADVLEEADDILEQAV